ncbi:Copper(I)-binding protein [Gracilimonas mengyeensis]|uniref:Copper(I)-binding protein n=2 Tax=Gracilimonas mengyeensis TaxID=1302730 RepID=A0A521DI45_9BACT|nr:Copper(I)-binding protein [Gracilimonas mengyeensis]
MIVGLTIGYTFVACSQEEKLPDVMPTLSGPEEWVRPAVKAGTSAAYFNYINELTIADTLLGVESMMAGITQVHESFKDADGMMAMKHKENVRVPAGDTLRFTQGGLHIMLMQLNEDLTEGDSVEVQLQFRQAGTFTKRLPVTSGSQ